MPHKAIFRPLLKIDKNNVEKGHNQHILIVLFLGNKLLYEVFNKNIL